MKKNLETLCIHSGYKAKKGEPQQLPIIQSTTFRYETSDQMARLFEAISIPVWQTLPMTQ